MAFVRKKMVNGIEYAQLVESTRINGKVKQKVLYCLGRVDKLKEVLEK
jgi:hypothetical protein